MNKFVTVLGVAAVATLAGCKDPNYKSMSSSQDDVKDVAPAPVSVTPAPAPVATPVVRTCKCPPGAKHTSPCACGAPDCACIVEVKALPPPVPETTTYIVQNGDFLAKISKRYNVSISSIKRLNGLKGDTIRIGQKLKLPGKIDVGVQKEPAQRPVRKAAAKAAADYSGATKDYVVRNGDTLGAIAYGNGCNIRQLKKLNNLTSDSLKVGQKLKVPATGKAVAAKASEPAKAVEPVKAAEPSTVSVAPVVEPPVAAATEPVTADAPAAPVADAPAPDETPTSTYTVQEGDDMTGVSIRFGVSAAAIRELNGLPEDAQLSVGQTIKLPADAQQ